MITPAPIPQKKETAKFEAFIHSAFVAVRPITIKFAIRKLAVVAAAVGVLCATSAGIAEEPVNMGVAIPAATHSFTAGIVFWAKIVFGGAGAKGAIKTLMDGSNPLIQANVSYSPKGVFLSPLSLWF